MRKFYSVILAASIVATTANAAELSRSVADVKPANPEKLTLSSSNAPVSVGTVKTTVPDGDWTNLGKGTWFDGLLDIFNGFDEGQSWEVDIYESETTPGYYRVAPYVSGTPAASITADDTAIFYINATDPTKVYVDGYVLYGNYVYFGHTVLFGYSDYGTLSDGVITFPAKSFAYTTNGSNWYFCNYNGDLKIGLPGADVKDYTLKSSAPACADGNNVFVTLTLGDDIAKVKTLTAKGYYTANDDNLDYTKSIGANMGLPTSFKVSATSTGFYSVIIAGLDSDNNVVAGTEAHVFLLDDDADNWEDFGTATFSEPLYSNMFNGYTAETLTAKVQKHVTDERYRIVDPYDGHSTLAAKNTSHDHTHYIYIDATDADKVFIEASPIGPETDYYGQGYIWSLADYYPAYYSAYYGTKEENTITFPANSLLMGLSSYSNGQILSVSHDELEIALTPAESAINAIAAEANAIDAAPVYYNLQGLRVTNPKAGDILIKRQGNTATKVVF